MQARCSLIFLVCTVFLGLNLLSEELLHIDQPPQQDASRTPMASSPEQIAELFKGDYALRVNGTALAQGVAHVALGARQTSALGVQVAQLSISLAGAGLPEEGSGRDPEDIEVHLAGIEIPDENQVTASGAADPSALARFGSSPCRLDAVLSLRGDRLQPQPPEGEGERRSLRGDISSADCGFSLHVTAWGIDLQRAGQKAVHYALWANFLTIIQMRCFISQMRHTDEGGPSAAKLSLVAVAMQALLDAYDAFLHLSLSASSRHLFNKFAFVALLKFMLFALLEFRYLLTIWRQRNRDLFEEGWDAVRRELSRIYSRFYAFLVGGLVLIFNFIDHLDLIVLVSQAYWVPQIFHDVRQGARGALEMRFIVGVSVARVLQIVYLWGCPYAIFDGDLYPKLPGAPSYWLCLGVVLLQSAQVALMFSQQTWGPRWFVPWLCLPHVYNYWRRIEVTPGSDCVICMGELEPEEGEPLATTPCDHRFHRACLERWLDVKMECPTCRRELPPMC